MIQVYIPDENITGYIITEMTHGAKIHYEKGGFVYEVWMTDEDYIVLQEIFFDHKEIE